MRKRKKSCIPLMIFEFMGGVFPVINLKDVMINGKAVCGQICQVTPESVGAPCGWMRYLFSRDGSFDVCCVEFHASEKSARRRISKEPGKDVVCYVYYVRTVYPAAEMLMRSPVNYNAKGDEGVFFLASLPLSLASTLQ
ncbi:MAG: hypothetical protein WCP15_02995 [bacterium]